MKKERRDCGDRRSMCKDRTLGSSQDVALSHPASSCHRPASSSPPDYDDDHGEYDGDGDHGGGIDDELM